MRLQDEVWAINCRGLCVSTPAASLQQLRIERYHGSGWVDASVAEFARPADDRVTSFFIVGNYYTHSETLEMGWHAYHQLVAACAERVKLRFVIWSWPSDPVPGRRLLDAKIKLTRVDPTAYHLAALIDRLDPATPVSICGSSYGVGIAAGSVQLLGGGWLGGYQLSPRSGATRRIRLVLLGAAIHNDGFLPGRKYDLVLAQAERTLVFVNPADRALGVYHWLFGRRSGAVAMGRSGPVGLRSLPVGTKADLVRSDRYVGRQHGMRPYWESPVPVAWMRPYLLMQPVSTNSARQVVGASLPSDALGATVANR
ncbi:MAG TPA: hypothetical protein VHC22_02845 [Pirellulales bacterium]|nr:hypothetical protein [Pirellulales bacterium]